MSNNAAAGDISRHARNPGIRSNRLMWEALFAVHLAFITMSLNPIPAWGPPLSRMECRINEFLHIPQTDFVRGYFAIWVPTLALSVIVWLSLRVFRGARLAREGLRAFAGIATLIAPPVYWVVHYEATLWPVGWPYRGAPLEIALVLLWAAAFLKNKWNVPKWTSILVVAAHFGYWYFAPSSEPEAPNYGGPFGPGLGFCAALTWIIYVSRLRTAGIGPTSTSAQ